MKIFSLFLFIFSTNLFAIDYQDIEIFRSNEARECFSEIYKLAKKKDRSHNPKEYSAWISINSNGQVECIRWDKRPGNRCKENSCQWRGVIPKGTIANIHTHPSFAENGMSEVDIATSNSFNLPFYAISSRGKWIYKTVPFERDYAKRGKKVFGRGGIKKFIKALDKI